MFPIGAWIFLGLIVIAVVSICSYKLMPKIGNGIVDRAIDIKHTILNDKEEEKKDGTKKN